MVAVMSQVTRNSMMNNFLESSLSSVVSMDLSSSWAARSWESAFCNQSVDRARFQQKQLQEKEQKLLRMYENQQQKAFQRVGRGSAGSNSSGSSISSTSSLGGGKVRQLFEERRNGGSNGNNGKSGWDRSYPLEPLAASRKTKADRGVSLDRQQNSNNKNLTYRSKSQVRPELRTNNVHPTNSYYYEDDNSNKLFEYRGQPEINQLEDLYSKHNLLDYEEPPDYNGYSEDDTDDPYNINNKYKTYNASVRKMAPPAVAAKDMSNGVKQIQSRRTTQEPALPKKTTVQKELKPKLAATTLGSSSQPRAVPAATVKKTNNVQKVATTRTTPTTTNAPARPAAKSTARAPLAQSSARDDLMPCSVCGRRFAEDRVKAHMEICSKTSQKKRKAFDPLKQRVKGTEAEVYLRKIKQQQTQPPKEVKKSNWRKKHEEFIANIRAAKEAQAFLAAGGKVSDLPPPPPSDTSDYIQCPHCSRKFNEGAAERHIPKCANMQHNKPKPVTKGAVPKRRY